MTYKIWQGVFTVLLSLLAATDGNSTRPQTKKDGSPSSPKWIENKVLVRVDSPYLSDSGSLVLAYTVTNKSGQDIQLKFTDSPTSLEEHKPMRVFLKLKDPDSYSQVKRKDDFLYLADTLLPADLPVSFGIVLRVSSKDKPSWFSSDSTEDRLWRLLQKNLGNADSIVIFVPDRQIKIKLPIPGRPKQ